MAIRHVVDMVEGLDNDYNDEDDYTFEVSVDPLDEATLVATVRWSDDRPDEEYEIKIERVV